MTSRICLAFLLALCLCSLAGAAATEPTPAITAEGVSAQAVSAQAEAAPLAADAPADSEVPATAPLAWLAPAPNQSLPPTADFMPAFSLRTCTSDCGVTFQNCKLGCNGDSLCLQDCADQFGCCRYACVGWGCP
jgi:hypothetical protein